MTKASAKRGRPPKISREDIAESAIRLGIGKATIRTVADEMGVSVPAVYLHVRDADELRDLAMARELSSLLGPLDEFSTFEDALFNAAQRFYELLRGYPEQIYRVVTGQIDKDTTAQYHDLVIGCGVAHGLTHAEARQAMIAVLAAAAGAAMFNSGNARAGLALSEDESADQKPVLHGTHPRDVHGDALEPVRIALLGLRAQIGERMCRGKGGIRKTP